MAKVVVQLINDLGEVENESAVAVGVPIEEAQAAMMQLLNPPQEHLPALSVRLVTELHYADGDVGAYDDWDVRALWSRFSKSHEASHIVIRPDTEGGQVLSNGLYAAAKRARAAGCLSTIPT